GVPQHGGHIDRLLVRLLDNLAVVLAEAVQGRATLDQNPRRRHLADLDRVVLAGEDRLRDVAADLLGVHVEGGHKLHVRDVVVAELDVHQPRYAVVGVGVAVVLHALHEGRGAVTDTNDGDTNRTHRRCLLISHLRLLFSVTAYGVSVGGT